MPNNQIAKRNNNHQMAKALGVAALQSLVGQFGVNDVVSMVARGLYHLTREASAWLSRNAKQGNQLRGIAPIVQSSVPAAVGMTVTGNAKFKGDIRFKHRELIQTIEASDATQSQWTINPANAFAFPFLATIARSYDKYRFHSLRFQIISSSPSSNGGRWYLMWDPDSEDITGNTTQGFMASKYSLSSTAWQSGTLMGASSDEKYLSYGVSDALKDHGVLQLITRGTTATFDVYVEYDVSLKDANAIASTNFIASTSIGSNFFIGGPLPGIGPPYAVRVADGSFRLAAGFYDIFFTVRGVGLAASFTNSAANAAAKLYTSSTTHAVYRVVGSSDGTAVVSWTGSSTSISAYTVSVTSLTRSAYDLIVTNFA